MGGTTEPHFATYLTHSGMIVSFNGLSFEPTEIMEFLIVRGRQYGCQTDDWSCGYRALFWASQLLLPGRIDEELAQI
jgi:hypothetical protein